MKQRMVGMFGLAVSLALVLTLVLQGKLQSAEPPYPNMAPLNQYLIADQNVEIALAKSAGPKSIADKADVLVLGRDGYKVAVKGNNGFVCVVERSWAASTTSPDFWNPKLRAPNCFNAAASRTFLPIFLMRTKLVLAGKSKAEMLRETELALDKKELPRGHWRYLRQDEIIRLKHFQ